MTNLRFSVAIIFIICLSYSPRAGAQQAYHDEIKKYAVELFASFTRTQQMSGKLSFSDTARLKWNNLPVGLRARVGTSIGNMNDEQRKILHRILSASLSSQGYLKATGIMHLDDLLNRYYDSLYYKKELDDKTYNMIRGLLWSHKNYFFAFFGDPSDKVWGYKLE
jgi:Protein of unknown function (DUF3500)